MHRCCIVFIVIMLFFNIQCQRNSWTKNNNSDNEWKNARKMRKECSRKRVICFAAMCSCTPSSTRKWYLIEFPSSLFFRLGQRFIYFAIQPLLFSVMVNISLIHSFFKRSFNGNSMKYLTIAYTLIKPEYRCCLVDGMCNQSSLLYVKN